MRRCSVLAVLDLRDNVLGDEGVLLLLLLLLLGVCSAHVCFGAGGKSIAKVRLRAHELQAACLLISCALQALGSNPALQTLCLARYPVLC